MSDSRIEISLDTCAILHHRETLSKISRKNPSIRFAISTVVIGEIFEHPTDDLHNFVEFVGTDRWQLGYDWFARLLSKNTRQLVSETQLAASRKNWSFRQRLNVRCLVKEMRRYRKRYETFRSEKRAKLRDKLNEIASNRGIPQDTKWFSTLEKCVSDWDVNMQDSLFALEAAFPKERFAPSNPVVALSGFLMFARLAGVLMDTDDAKESKVGDLKTSPLYPFFGSNEKRINFFDIRIASEAMGRKYFASSDANLIAALQLAEKKNLIDFKLLDLNKREVVEASFGL